MNMFSADGEAVAEIFYMQLKTMTVYKKIRGHIDDCLAFLKGLAPAET
jgi:hypothetical protein